MAVLIHSLRLFEAESIKVLQQSPWYGSKAFPAGAGPDYVNGVVQISSDLHPDAVLAGLHRIEAEMGRTRAGRWDARVCDLDLLAFDTEVLPELAGFQHWFDLPLDLQKTNTPTRLVLPHPRLQDRAFVLVPFADIAPDWRHPVLGKTVSEMLADLPKADIASVWQISLQ